MDSKSNIASPVLADSTALNEPMLGIHSSLLPYSQSAGSFSSGKYVAISRKMPDMIDDVLSNGWLDAMRSSSPPRKKFIMDINVEIPPNESDDAYSSWMLKYPSALKCFEEITENAENKKLAIFLDYDGTLSPIVENPDRAFMSDAMRSAVRNVAKFFPTAIISGRSRNKVYELVGLTELCYAGSHGMDILGPESKNHPDYIKSTDQEGKVVNLFQPARKFIPMIDEVFRTLVENTNEIEGSKVENHKFCVSVHYRNVDEKSWPTIAQCVHDILKDYPRLQLRHGRKVLDIRPVIDWDKGKAVEFLLESLGLKERDDVLPIYIGDDKTDEDAFKVLREGNLGFGILVSPVPKESNAFYSLKDTSEVRKFLESLVKWKKGYGKADRRSI